MLGNISIINKSVSNELNLPEAEVARINSYFWKEAKNIMADSEETNFYVRNLGTYTSVYRQVRRQLWAMLGRLKALRGKDSDRALDQYKNIAKRFRLMWTRADKIKKHIWEIQSKKVALSKVSN